MVTKFSRLRLLRCRLIAICLAMALGGECADGQGIFPSSVGPVNQSFGGTATACPLDSAGALFWNPATINGLRSSDMSFALGVAIPWGNLSSSINAGALGPGAPATTLSGSSSSQSGASPIPTFSFVQKSADSPWAVGIGLFTLGGYTDNYPASTSNPILTPAPPYGYGAGQIAAQAQIYQVTPTAAYAVNEQLSFGVGLNVDFFELTATPLFLAPPNDANHDGYSSYGPGTGSKVNFGGGFQAGVYYIANDAWRFGASFKSPQWFETVRINSHDELGNPTRDSLDFTLPLVVSWGVAYSGFENWILSTDVRYYDYSDAATFKQSGYNSDGSVAGLGWRSIFAVNNGVQYLINPRLALRAGYQYNQNPISNSLTQFNIASTLITQHVLSCGASYKISNRVTGNLAYSHGFANSISGPFIEPAGPVAGTSITARTSYDYMNAGLTVPF